MTTLTERITRLTGPCRETDEDIARAVGYQAWGSVVKKGYGWNYNDPEGRYIGAPPKFTESLDAAMTLARNNREAMLMIYSAFSSFESDEMGNALNIFLRIKAMLLTNIRARAASESSH